MTKNMFFILTLIRTRKLEIIRPIFKMKCFQCNESIDPVQNGKQNRIKLMYENCLIVPKFSH